MKKWKYYHFCIFIILCVLLNQGGRMLCRHFQMPLWLDSFGTVLCAYLCGPVCGSIVGLTANIIGGMQTHMSYIYGLTSMAMGIVVGVAANKKLLDTMFGTMTVSSIAALIAIAVSTPLNIIFYGGSTGNVWGNGAVAFAQEIGIPFIPACVIGQFYVEFLDKVITLMILHVALRIIKKFGKKDPEEKEGQDGGQAVRMLSAVLAVFLLCQVGSVKAEEETAAGIDYNNYVQTVYSSNNGLPCGEANDIAQTNDGILWIGTYAGLYRYNGREFRWMDNYESVRNVNCLYVDEEGRLWIGTNDNGLAISINEKIVNVIDQSRGLPSNSVRSIVQSTDGYYYIGTTGSMQVLTLSGGLKRITNLWEINYADCSAADASGRVAAVTAGGRLYLMRGGRILSSRQLTDAHEIFRSCCFDPQGRLLAGTSLGRVFTYDVNNDWFELLSVQACGSLRSIKHLGFLENGDLIISSDNGVGYISPEGVFHPINTNDFSNSIDNMLSDYQGNLWFASSRLGLLRMTHSAFMDVYTTVGMTGQVVNAIEKWNGVYYIGTDTGLDAVNGACKSRVQNELTEKLRDVRIRCMKADKENHLWICTYGSGLMEVEEDGTTHLYNSDNGSFGNRARLVMQLKDGTILAGGDTGISFIRDHAIQRTIGFSDGLINSMILTATELEDGKIIAGTDGDGIAVIEDGQVTRMLTRRDGLSSEVILRTVSDPKSNGVFIVTSNGLCYMDEDFSVRSLNQFPYFNNYDICFSDPDTLFVMSSAGIYVAKRDELLSGSPDFSCDLLDTRRGLNSALTANSWYYYDEDNDLFLPCDTGVFIINTKQYAMGSKAYRIALTNLRLDGKSTEIERGRPIVINRGVSKVEAVPEFINYTIQDPYVGYYLEGFDSRWTIINQNSLNSIVYTNLPVGTYTLHLAVFDNNQQEVFSERTYQLIKEKEIYDEPWFMVYLVVVLMMFVAWVTWFIVRNRVQRMLERQQHELALAQQQVQMGNETIFAIAKAVDAKDERTSQHSQRVALYSVMIAQTLGLSEKDCESVRKTALMHDLGKIGIPDSILNKPARLTDEEYAIMKTHTLRGADILKDFTLIDHVVEGALHHHERYDGRGYPDGLKGEEIPLFARIIGVADAFDAMTANRVYRRQMDFDYVLNEMKNGRGTQFDPQMVDILLKLVDEGKINLKELYPAKPEEAEKSEG